MKSSEFAYWLQGWFELQEPHYAGATQTALMRAHLALVFACDPTPSGFCCWLRNWFHHENPPVLGDESITAIRDELQKEFIHVIDPSYPNQDVLNAIHGSVTPAGRPPIKQSDKPVMMGKDGVTPDSGLHFDPNSHSYVPGARC
jgi:hypothetical protein